MSIITNSARFLLFGPKMDARVTLTNVAKHTALNAGRRAMGLPPTQGPTLWDWIIDQGKRLWAYLTGRHPDALPLPDDLPVGLFNAVNDTLRNRGGYADREGLVPNYWLNPGNVTSTPFFWSLVVDYAPSADPAKVSSFEMALEDAITRAGYDYNVRIQKRPLRLEIDKPSPPTITLAELWPLVAAYQQNARWAVLGLAYLAGQSTTLFMSFDGEDFSGFIAGRPGSGKTQLSMAILLSLAYTNSPACLTMIIVDPKAVDFRPFNALPHLALPVINEAVQAVEVIQALCSEMDRRTACAARGDSSFFAHTICLYVDELADLYMSLPNDMADSLVKNFQRLGQKGRGVGFVILGATQRVYDIPDSLHGKLNARFAGRARNANDSVAISGVPGTTTNRLPGRGSFELYCSDQQGLRLQAPFVAASDQPGYEQALAPFFADINARWQGATPGWTLPGRQTDQVDAQPVDQATPPADAPTGDQGDNVTRIEIDARIWQRMLDAYRDGKLSGNLIRRLHQEILQRSIDGNRAKMILNTFLESQQHTMATITENN